MQTALTSVNRNFHPFASHGYKFYLSTNSQVGTQFMGAFSERVSPEQVRKLGLGSFLYAGLFLAEGTGLWLRKRWGEWLTVIITSSLVPVEIYEIYRHVGWGKVVALALNVAIVIYLIFHMRKKGLT